MNIVVLTMFSKEYAEIAAFTLANQVEYCQRHGYKSDAIFLENGQDWPYKKHDRIKELFAQGANIVWYKDIDSIITNISTPITSFVYVCYSMFITKDVHEINGGSLVLKNDYEGRWLNDTILAQKEEFENEQNAINWLMGDPQFNQFVKVLPHPSINSYDYSLYEHYPDMVSKPELGDWQEGYLLLHTPGLSLDKRLEVLKNAKITR